MAVGLAEDANGTQHILIGIASQWDISGQVSR
jgi:hypothetical protein